MRSAIRVVVAVTLAACGNSEKPRMHEPWDRPVPHWVSGAANASGESGVIATLSARTYLRVDGPDHRFDTHRVPITMIDLRVSGNGTRVVAARLHEDNQARCHVETWVEELPFDIPTMTVPIPSDLTWCPTGYAMLDERLPDRLMRTCVFMGEGAPPFDVPLSTMEVVDGSVVTAHFLAPTMRTAWPECTRCFEGARKRQYLGRDFASNAVEVVWDARNNPVMVQEYGDERRNGYLFVFYPSGMPAVIGMYVDDAADGVWMGFDERGAIIDAHMYVYGVDIGPIETRPETNAR